MKKLLIALFLIASSAAAGYFFAPAVYSFYVKIYYSHQKNAFENDLKRGEDLYAKGEYDEYENLLKRMLIFSPDDARLLKFAARFYIVNRSDFVSGETYLQKCLTGKPSDMDLLSSVIPALFQARYYGDVASILRRYSLRGKIDMEFMRGYSLHMTAHYDDAMSSFNRVESLGMKNFLLYKSMAEIYEMRDSSGQGGKSDLRRAAYYYEKARQLRSADTSTEIALIRIYTKLGENRLAERVAGYAR